MRKGSSRVIQFRSWQDGKRFVRFDNVIAESGEGFGSLEVNCQGREDGGTCFQADATFLAVPFYHRFGKLPPGEIPGSVRK
jgi:hypothetical protein